MARREGPHGYGVETETQESGQFYDGEPIPVHIASSAATPTKTVAPEYASCTTWPIGQVGVNQPTQILTRRIYRERAYVVIRTATAAQITLNSNLNALTGSNPQGIALSIAANTTNTNFPEWVSQQPLYAISSQADTQIFVVDSSYGED